MDEQRMYQCKLLLKQVFFLQSLVDTLLAGKKIV